MLRPCRDLTAMPCRMRSHAPSHAQSSIESSTVQRTICKRRGWAPSAVSRSRTAVKVQKREPCSQTHLEPQSSMNQRCCHHLHSHLLHHLRHRRHVGTDPHGPRRVSLASHAQTAPEFQHHPPSVRRLLRRRPAVHGKASMPPRSSHRLDDLAKLGRSCSRVPCGGIASAP